MKKIICTSLICIFGYSAYCQMDSTLQGSVFIDQVFGGLKSGYILAFFLFSGFGMLFTIGVTYFNRADKTKTFDFNHFTKDNWLRILFNLLVVFIVLRFHDDVYPKREINMLFGLVLGAGIDGVIIVLRKFTGINIFQAKEEAK